MVTPDEGQTYTPLQQLGSRALTTGSWVGVCLLKGLATDRVPIPRAITVVATGVAVYVLDDVSAELYDRLIRKADGGEAESRGRARATTIRRLRFLRRIG